MADTMKHHCPSKGHMRKLFAGTTVLFFVLIFSAGMPVTYLPPVPPTVDTITPGELRMHLEFLASDELGGRYTLAPNFAISARYLASHLKAYGFHGAAEHGDFLQRFEVITSHVQPAATSLRLKTGIKTVSYELGDIYPGNSGVSGHVSGQVVFVGFGISSPSQKHDDYAGLDVKGKIVLVAPGSPANVDISLLADDENGDEAALAHGAVGILSIPPAWFGNLAGNPSFMKAILGRNSFRLARGRSGALPELTLGKDVAEKLLSLAGLDLKTVYAAARQHRTLKPVPLDASAVISVKFDEQRTITQNVVGVLDGTDPHLKNEYVALSAHYDHLKTGKNGEVFHGADDDGSGTVAILTIARALAQSPPRRSIMVIFHAGEELGLLGSEYNTEIAPAVPLDKIVAAFNIDMIGRSKPPGDDSRADEHLTDARTVYLVGSDRISHELHRISEATNQEFQKLHLDYHYNDPANPEQIYFRSDHWNYARHGVPVIFYFDGVHADYHKTTDTVDKIDFDKMTRISRLVFETAWRIADLDHRLAKDAQ